MLGNKQQYQVGNCFCVLLPQNKFARLLRTTSWPSLDVGVYTGHVLVSRMPPCSLTSWSYLPHLHPVFYQETGLPQVVPRIPSSKCCQTQLFPALSLPCKSSWLIFLVPIPTSLPHMTSLYYDHTSKCLRGMSEYYVNFYLPPFSVNSFSLHFSLACDNLTTLE